MSLPRYLSLRARTAAALLALAPAVSASTLEWQGGSGTWDTTSLNWLDDGTPVAWPNTGNESAILGGDAGTISISGQISAVDVDLHTTGRSLSVNYGNSAKLSLSGGLTGKGAVIFPSSGQVRRYSDEVLERGVHFNGGEAITVDADFVGRGLQGAPVLGVWGEGTQVTLTGEMTVANDGGQTFVSLAPRDGGHLIFGDTAEIDVILGGSFFTRQLWIHGDGTGTIEFAEGFVADRTEGATVPRGLGSYRLSNSTLITHHTQGLPTSERPDGSGGTQINGHLVFENEAGSEWIVRSNPQTYNAGVWIQRDMTLNTEEDLTHTGVTTFSSHFGSYWAANAFQTDADNVTVTKTGPASLILAAEAAFRPGSVLRIDEGAVVFETDPTAGVQKNIAPATAGPNLDIEVSWGNRTGISQPYSNFNAGRAEFTAPYANLNSIDNHEGFVVIGGEVELEGDFTQNHQEFIGNNARPNRRLEPEAGYLVFRLGAAETVQLHVKGTATLGGFLQIEREEDFLPAPGTEIDIIMHGNRSGSFAALNDFSDLGLMVEYLEDRIRLTTTREAGRTGVVVDEDFTDGEFSNPNWTLINRPGQVGFFAPAIERPGIPQALVHRVDHGTFTWGVAFLDTPTFRIGPDEVLVQKMTTYSDVARGNHQYYKIEIAALHADTHAPFGHNRSAELSRNYSTQAGNQWQIFPSLYNDDVTRVPNAHHSGGSTSSTLLNADNSMVVFRPVGDGSTTRVEALGANQINPNLTIPFPLEHWNTLQVSMPRQWAGTDNVLATGVSREDAQMGMSYVHVGVTHRTDATVDYVTDAADFIVWNSYRGQSGTHLQTGDFTNDGTTGDADLALLIEHLGTVHDPDFRRSLRYETLDLPGSGTPPEFIYESETGRMTLIPNGTAISAWQIPGPEADFVATPLSGDWWTAYVAGKQQWVDLELDGVGGPVLIGFFPAGLTDEDFGDVFFGYASGGGGTVAVMIEGPPPEITVVLDEQFQTLDNWKDLSTAVIWDGSPPSGSVFQITDGVLNLNDESRTASMWSNPGGIRSYSSIDYQFPEPVTHRTNTITVEFRLRWDSISATGESGRVAFMLLHDYPEGGLDLTPEARVSDFSQHWWARPAYQVRIRSGFNPPDAASYFMYGGGTDIDGEFETGGDPPFWLAGFVSGPGGVTPGTNPTHNFPNSGWYMGTTAPASTTFKRYRYVVLPNAQQLWINHEDDGETWVLDMEMPLPFEEDAPTDPEPPLYRYFEQLEGLRIYFRSPGAGSSAPNTFLDYVTITVEGDYHIAPPAADYVVWAQDVFGADYGDPATEDTLWGPKANPSGDGIRNELKFAMGLDPMERAEAALLRLAREPDGTIIFPFTVSDGFAAAQWGLEMSEDLGAAEPWEPVPTEWIIDTGSGDGYTRYEAIIGPGEAPASVFLRLRFDL